MKVAATLTNTTTEVTALPSLLSLDAELPLRPDERPADASPEPSSTESPASFDAVLAMVQLAQNLPLPLPEPAITAEATTTFASCAAPVAMPVVEPVTAAPNPLGVEPATMSIQRLLPSPSKMSHDLPDRAEPAPHTSEREFSTNLAPNAEPTVSADQVLSSRPDQTKTAEMIPPLPIERRSNVVDPKMPSGELPGTQARSLDVEIEMPADSSSVDAASPPNGPIAASDGGPELPLEVMATGHNSSRSMRPTDAFREVHQLAVDRHRRSASAERGPAELIGLTSHARDAVNDAARLDATALTESVAVAVQTHGNDLAANRPVEVQLRLDPPELGMVRVHLRVTDDSVSIRFIAGDEAVTRLLETQLPDLRQSLAERGLSFAQCDVSCDSRQQSSSGFGFGQDAEPFASASSTRSAPTSLGRSGSASRVSVAHQSRVDLFA